MDFSQADALLADGCSRLKQSPHVIHRQDNSPSAKAVRGDNQALSTGRPSHMDPSTISTPNSISTSSRTLPTDVFSRKNITNTAKTTPGSDVTGNERAPEMGNDRDRSPSYSPSCTYAAHGSVSEEEPIFHEQEVDVLWMGAQFDLSKLSDAYPTTLTDIEDELRQEYLPLSGPFLSEEQRQPALPDYIFDKSTSFPLGQSQNMDNGTGTAAQVTTPETSCASPCQVDISLREIVQNLLVLVFLTITVFVPRLATFILKCVGLVATTRIILHIINVLPAYQKHYWAMAAMCLLLIIMMVTLALQVQHLS